MITRRDNDWGNNGCAHTALLVVAVPLVLITYGVWSVFA